MPGSVIIFKLFPLFHQLVGLYLITETLQEKEVSYNLCDAFLFVFHPKLQWACRCDSNEKISRTI